MPTRITNVTAVVDQSGANELVAAPGAGKRIRVFDVAVNPENAINPTLDAGATRISELGPTYPGSGVRFVSRTGARLPEDTALSLTLDAAVSTSVTLSHWIEG